MKIVPPRSRKCFACAFTMTELLVTLAIVLLLAAILFPIFGAHRYRSQQVICAANEEQQGRATRLYTQDYDDKYPMAFGIYPGIGWMTGYAGSVPYNWQCANGICGPNTTAAYGSFWVNSIAPYLGNVSVYNCPSTVTSTQFQGNQAKGAPPPAKASYTYNGLLQSYPAASVKFPARVPLFWEGNGKSNYLGFASANPQLNCEDVSKPCLYIPTTTSCSRNDSSTSTLYPPPGSEWVHGKGQNFLMTDGHTRWLRLGLTAVGKTTTDYYNDPGAVYDANGFIKSTWSDGCHVVFFAPDFSHSP